MKENDLKKLIVEVKRLSDFYQEINSTEMKKKYPLLAESGQQVFENELKRLEDWIGSLK